MLKQLKERLALWRSACCGTSSLQQFVDDESMIQSLLAVAHERNDWSESGAGSEDEDEEYEKEGRFAQEHPGRRLERPSRLPRLL